MCLHDEELRSRTAAAAMRMHIGAQLMAALSDETLGKAERQREEDTLGWKKLPIDRVS